METLNGLLLWGKRELEAAGVAEYELDAWLLLSFATGVDRAKYLADRNKGVSDEAAGRYKELITNRAKRIPLQQLTGWQEFMGLTFEVDDNVLIPRQDTELLVEEAGKRIKEKTQASVLDLCTGSGCIITSLAYYYGRLGSGQIVRAVGSDRSGRALEIAEKNAARHGVEVSFLKGDLFEAVEGSFDLIVSNPPYIPSSVIESLEPEVREYEPRMALDGGEDGLYFYRRITEQAAFYLTAGGYLLYEIGHDQGEAVASILKENGYADIRIYQDLAGLDRVCLGKKMEE